MRILDLFDPGSGIEKFGSGINILDPATLLIMKKEIYVCIMYILMILVYLLRQQMGPNRKI